MPIFKTPGPTTITVSAVYAEVTLTAGQGRHDTDSTTAEVTPKDPSNRKDVDEAESIRIEQPSPTEITITAPPAGWLAALNRGTAVIRVVCPKDSRAGITNTKGGIKLAGDLAKVEVRSGNGSVDIKHAVVAETVTVRTSNGSISLGEGRGKVDLRTRSGSVDVDCARAEAHLDSNAGAITVRHVDGNLYAHTNNGAVEVGYAGSAVDASTNNGTVRLGYVVSGSVRGKTNNGKVFCGVAEGANVASLETRTLSGRVHDSLGERAGAGEDVSVELRTNSGDISVSRARPSSDAAGVSSAAGPSGSHVTEEEDWGPVPSMPDTLPDTLPPRYNQEWRGGETAPAGEGKKLGQE